MTRIGGICGPGRAFAPGDSALPRPACHQGVYARLRRAMERVGVRGPFRVSELAETPPHRAEFWLSSLPRFPLPARGARNAVLPGSRPAIGPAHHAPANLHRP